MGLDLAPTSARLRPPEQEHRFDSMRRGTRREKEGTPGTHEFENARQRAHENRHLIAPGVGTTLVSGNFSVVERRLYVGILLPIQKVCHVAFKVRRQKHSLRLAY